MLSSNANQYLRPECLTPLPTTLDAKNSPLALLAQTCSQIGVDSAPGKNLLLDKTGGKSSRSGEQSREKSSPASSSSTTAFRPYDSCLGREKSASPDVPRAGSCNSARSRASGNKRCSSNQSASSTRTATPQGLKESSPNAEMSSRASPTGPSKTPGSASVEAAVAGSHHPIMATAAGMHEKAHPYGPAGLLAMTDPSIRDLPLGTFRPGVVTSLPSSTSTYLSGYASQLPIDVMASSLHHTALKNALPGTFYGYARPKTSQGSSTDASVCKDPICTAAQASPYAHLGAAAYAHAHLAALAAVSQLPFVCNWMTADSVYCGKRFPTSEELLQHLRNHTSATSGAAGNAAADPSSAALSTFLQQPVPLPPTHPLFSRTYPTPPLSPLGSGRYHPYGKHPHLPPSLASLALPLPPPHPHAPVAGLPPYFSPYSIYGHPRLGAASGMHP